MSLSRLARLLTVPIGTALVLSGVLAPFGRPQAGAAGDHRVDGLPSFQATSGSFDEKPLDAEAVTATASLTVSIVPERARLRFGVRPGCSDATAGVGAPRPAATRTPRSRPRRDALPAERLAERAGRCSAPSTAPPTPTT